MKRFCLSLVLSLLICSADAQTLQQKLESATNRFLADTQMAHGILGFHVTDMETGETVFSHNGRTGLAPASTQKIITSVAAFDLLGKEYRYKTEMGYTGELDDEQLKGDLYFKGYGDPTLGSNRYESARPEAIFEKIIDHLRRFRVKKITGNIYLDASAFGIQPLPGGWIWDDIGNYYGAGNWSLNWRENQYDLLLKPGSKAGDPVEIVGTTPEVEGLSLVNGLVTGRRGSGDNAYIYNPPYSTKGFVEGSYEGGRKISGALPDGPAQFGFELRQALEKNGIKLGGKVEVVYRDQDRNADIFFAHHSPQMDSIVYWFMRKSINLYGEALLRTIALEKTGVGNIDSGLAVIKRYYKDNNILMPAEVRTIDGSGLSPSNRVTAEALVKMLLHAARQDWFPAFANSFPDYNGMALKSGTIRGAKAFAGFHTSAQGKRYAVAIIVNNYDGSAGSIVAKMYKLLDILK